jgi:hypothetical protein
MAAMARTSMHEVLLHGRSGANIGAWGAVAVRQWSQHPCSSQSAWRPRVVHRCAADVADHQRRVHACMRDVASRQWRVHACMRDVASRQWRMHRRICRWILPGACPHPRRPDCAPEALWGRGFPPQRLPLPAARVGADTSPSGPRASSLETVSRMVAISKSGSGEGPRWVATGPGRLAVPPAVSCRAGAVAFRQGRTDWSPYSSTRRQASPRPGENGDAGQPIAPRRSGPSPPSERRRPSGHARAPSRSRPAPRGRSYPARPIAGNRRPASPCSAARGRGPTHR